MQDIQSFGFYCCNFLAKNHKLLSLPRTTRGSTDAIVLSVNFQPFHLSKIAPIKTRLMLENSLKVEEGKHP